MAKVIEIENGVVAQSLQVLFFLALDDILKNVCILELKWLFLPVASWVGPERMGKRGTQEVMVISLQHWRTGNSQSNKNK